MIGLLIIMLIIFANLIDICFMCQLFEKLNLMKNFWSCSYKNCLTGLVLKILNISIYTLDVSRDTLEKSVEGKSTLRYQFLFIKNLYFKS